MPKNSAALQLLEIVDAVLFDDSVQESSLNLTWGALDPTTTQMRRIAAKIRGAFGVQVEQSDRAMFGFDVTLGQACDELTSRMAVLA